MKVVLVGSFGLEPKGTVSMRALPLGMALAKRGHVVTVIVPPWDNPADSGKRFRTENVEIINMKLPPRIPLLWPLLLTFQMLQVIRLHKPDVVHCFKPKGFSGVVADFTWLLQKLKLSKSRMIMDTDDLEGKGGWNDIAPYSFLEKWVFSWQENHGLRQADAVTTASASLTRFVVDLGVSEERVYYVPNGASRFQMEKMASRKLDIRAEYGLGSNSVVLLYTRFFEFGLPRVIQILKRIFQQVPDANLLIVGKGLFGEEEAFRKLLQEENIADKARFAGWVQPEYLGSFFSTSDIALYPMDDTLLNKTKCPVKLIDLLSAGVPVVAARVGQTTEYIEDGISGYLVDPEDSDLFVNRAVSLLKDIALRKRIGGSAKEIILARFHWDELAATVEEAYAKK